MASPKKVLITGAMGGIGSALHTALRRQPGKYDVYALDRSSAPSERVPASRTVEHIVREKFHQCDMAIMQEVADAVQGMDVVVHLAADPGAKTWESTLTNNIIPTYNIFEASRRAGVKRLIVASSINVSAGQFEQEPYKAILEGRFGDVPAGFRKLTVDVAPEPRTLYAATKIWTESLAQLYAYTYGMSCFAIRIGGVWQSPGSYKASIHCSMRDIVRLHECCIDADESVRFGIFYGMSNNDWVWVDMQNARDLVGWVPVDRVEDVPTDEPLK